MHIARRIISLTTFALALGACSGLPVQPNESPAVLVDGAATSESIDVVAGGPAAAAAGDRSVEINVYDMEDVYFQAECEDGTVSELVAMTGAIEERITMHTDGSGTLHMKVNTKSRGLSGTGVSSGEDYRARERTVASYQQADAGSMGSYRQDFRLVGRRTGVEHRLVVRGNYTLDANGDVVRDRSTVRMECSV